MEPIDYLRVIRRRWRLLAACVVIAAAAAWVLTPAEPANDQVTYSATHTLLRDTQQGSAPALPTVALYVKSGAVPARVAERVGFDAEPALLAARVTLTPDEQVGTLEITATGSSRQRAADLTNAFAEETQSYLGEQAQQAQQDQIAQANEVVSRLQAEIDSLEREIETAEANGQATATLEAERDSRIRQYGAALDQQQQALGAAAPTSAYLTLQEALPELAKVVGGGFAAPQSRPARTVLAAGLGVLLGLGAVFVAERIDTKVRTIHDAEAAFGLPVIAEIPAVDKGRERRILTDLDPLSSIAEAYRTLRAALLLTPATMLGRSNPNGDGATAVDEPQVVLVTSAAPGDGKTTTVANLAAAFAETGRSVLVLGCDFRRPEIHNMFDAVQSPGIADVLASDQETALRDIVRATPVSGVYLAPSGAALRNLGQVASEGHRLIEQARALADLVLIDTAPLLVTNEASELIPECDATIVVARVGRTTVDAARRTRNLLDRLGSTVAGVTLLGTAPAQSSYGGYYTTSAVSPKRRPAIPLRRRTIRSDEITDRIRPWHGSDRPGLEPSGLPSRQTPPGDDEIPGQQH